MSGMRCDLANMLRQVAFLIPHRKDVGGYSFALGEVADHIEGVRSGKHTLDEFADYYMLRPAKPGGTMKDRTK